MTRIIKHSTPLTCCIYESPVKAGGAVIYTPIFTSLGVEGEFNLGWPLEMAELMHWENMVYGSHLDTVWSTDRKGKERFLAVAPTGYSRRAV